MLRFNYDNLLLISVIRLTNTYSKELRNHEAAIRLHVAHFAQYPIVDVLSAAALWQKL